MVVIMAVPLDIIFVVVAVVVVVVMVMAVIADTVVIAKTWSLNRINTSRALAAYFGVP
jgi:hypothetical protein